MIYGLRKVRSQREHGMSGSDGSAEFVYSGEHAGGDERKEVRMGFAEAKEIGLVLGALTRPAFGIRGGPELALDEVFQSRNGQRSSKDDSFHRATGEGGVPVIDRDLDSEAAVREAGVDGVRVRLNLETGGSQGLRNAGGGCYGEVGIQRHDGFGVVIYSQAADEIERVARRPQRGGEPRQVMGAPSDPGNKLGFGHRGGEGVIALESQNAIQLSPDQGGLCFRAFNPASKSCCLPLGVDNSLGAAIASSEAFPPKDTTLKRIGEGSLVSPAPPKYCRIITVSEAVFRSSRRDTCPGGSLRRIGQRSPIERNSEANAAALGGAEVSAGHTLPAARFAR